MTATHPARSADANDLLAEGVQLRREQKDQQALAIFREVVSQQPSPRALAQLGLCEQALGLWVGAGSHIQAALKSTEDPWIRKHALTLEEALKVVQANLGSIEPWGTPPGAEVSLDGEVMGRLPLAQRLRATQGRHVLSVTASDHLPVSRVVEVRAGGLWREHIALAPADPPVLPAPPARAVGTAPAASVDAGIAGTPVALPSSSHAPAATEIPPPPEDLPMWRRVLPWSLATGAVLAAVFGVSQHIAWNDGVKKFDAISACGRSAPMKGADSRCQGLFDDFAGAQTRTLVGYGVAGVLGAGAATFFILNAVVANSTGDRIVRVAVGPRETVVFLTTTF